MEADTVKALDNSADEAIELVSEDTDSEASFSDFSKLFEESGSNIENEEEVGDPFAIVIEEEGEEEITSNVFKVEEDQEEVSEKEEDQEGKEVKKLLEKVNQKMSFILSLLAGKPKNNLSVSEEELAFARKERISMEGELKRSQEDVDNLCDEIIEGTNIALLEITGQRVINAALISNGYYDEMEEGEDKEVVLSEKFSTEDIRGMKEYRSELEEYLEKYVKGIEETLTMEDCKVVIFKALNPQEDSHE